MTNFLMHELTLSINAVDWSQIVISLCVHVCVHPCIDIFAIISMGYGSPLSWGFHNTYF